MLGTSNPTSVNCTFFFLLSQHFGTGGSQEHHQIGIEDLKGARDATTGNILHVEWNEGPTKTSQDGLHKRLHVTPVVQKLMMTGGPCFPVPSSETLISKRPAEMHHG